MGLQKNFVEFMEQNIFVDSEKIKRERILEELFFKFALEKRLPHYESYKIDVLFQWDKQNKILKLMLSVRNSTTH